MSWAEWFRRRAARGNDLDKELRFHIDARVLELIQSGMSAAEARRSVRQEFGGIEQVKEQCRDVRPTRWIEVLAQDLRISVRALKRNPGFAFTAVATLALAIGVNTAIFSLVSFTLLEPLPYPNADRIVQFWFGEGGGGLGLSIPEVTALTSESSVFEAVAAYDFSGPGVSLTGSGEAEQVSAVHVSADYFGILGAPVAVGRTFTAAEDRPNGGRFVVLSHEVWQRCFGGDAAVVGKPVSLGHEPYIIVGVLASSFRADPPAQVWLPLQADPDSASHAHYLRAIGRLRPGVTLEQANARLKVTFAGFLRRYPLFNSKAGFQVKPLHETQVGDIRTALLVLLSVVFFVLLIACSNVANLLLAKATVRRHELAIRAALGGSRMRLLVQLLTESGILALSGGLLGLVAGRVCLRLLLALNPEAIPGGGQFASVPLDWRVLVFTGAVCFVATIACGLLPALKASDVRLAEAIQSSGPRSGASRGRSRAGALLTVIEVALAVILLSGAGLMIRTFAALRHVETGIDTQRIVTLEMSLQGTNFGGTAAVTALVDKAVERIQALPGVMSAASTWTLPVELAFGSTFFIEGRALAANERVHGSALMRPVSSNYASVFKIPLKRGRFFTERDTAKSSSVAVISEAMAKKFWPQGNPIGERITLDKYMGPDFAAPPREIVGIVGDVRDLGVNREAGPMMYMPQSQVPNGMTALDVRVIPLTLAVRTAEGANSLTGAIQREIKAVSGGLAVGRVRSMDEVVKHSTARSDFNTVLLISFACVALILAAVGVYGLISFTVRQRTRELGIRMALGASRRRLLRMVIGESVSLVGAGVFLGAIGSVLLARYMESLLFGVTPVDPYAISGACLVLSLVAVLAALVPARRAARLDPAEVLRAT